MLDRNNLQPRWVKVLDDVENQVSGIRFSSHNFKKGQIVWFDHILSTYGAGVMCSGYRYGSWNSDGLQYLYPEELEEIS